MHPGHLNYFPFPLIFYAIFAGALLALFILLQLGVLRYAYMRIGLDSRVAMLVLLGSLLGSYVNIPVAQFSEERITSDLPRTPAPLTPSARHPLAHRHPACASRG